jgi:hypothetical protein
MSVIPSELMVREGQAELSGLIQYWWQSPYGPRTAGHKAVYKRRLNEFSTNKVESSL